jgi:hypothetical protein
MLFMCNTCVILHIFYICTNFSIAYLTAFMTRLRGKFCVGGNSQHFNIHFACRKKCRKCRFFFPDNLPAIAFAHNTAFNSAINCAPFEAGHGSRARTITEARASPRLQIITDRGKDLQEQDSKWESPIFQSFSKSVNMQND